MTEHTASRGPLEAIESMLDAIKRRDVPRILDSIDLSERGRMSFPEGPRWFVDDPDTVRRGWTDYMDTTIALTDWAWVEGPVVMGSDDVALVVGIIDYRFRVHDHERPLRMRMTWGLRRVDGNWKTMHEHGSQPLADPYGIGDWLKPEEENAS